MDIIRNETFDLAYRFVTETNLNIFLTGKAGTGKTTFLKYLREHSFKKMVVAAPTGVAAINAGGITLHSLFQLPFAPFIPARPLNASMKHGEQDNADSFSASSHGGASSLLSKIRYQREKRNLLRNLELLIIDEASMVASHTVDAVDTILRSVRRRHHLPFGGVQVLFIGDLHQLPPVVKQDEWQLLREYYSSVFFFDSIVLREHIPVMIELKEIFRQKDDSFIELLNEIRHNNLSRQNFDLLNSRQLPPGDFPAGAVTLTTHNLQADKINETELQKLKTKSYIFKSSVTGDFPEHMYPADSELTLKEGAQVMFIKNDNEGKKYFNGKTGVITSLSDGTIKVKCPGDEEEISVNRQQWENINYSLHPETREILENLLGSFMQYPLRLAWAITIHKSQGLTFEKVIIDAENAFARGQVYVALSRCTSLGGLFLSSPVNRQFLGAHHDLSEWQKKNSGEKDLSAIFTESRQKFSMQELQNIFNWKNWHYELKSLNSLFEENKDEIHADCFLWIKEIIEKQRALDDVAQKFSGRILQLCAQNPVVEENAILQQRVKDAANYFSAELNKWKEKFLKHPISADTKKLSRPVDASLEDINFILHGILHKLDYCKNGFILSGYLQKGKKFSGDVSKPPSSYALKQAKISGAKESLHPALYVKIAGLRKHWADIHNFPLYVVFSNAAIKNVCDALPADKESLLKVKGFGKAKVKEYGDDIIDLVREYCGEHNLVPQEIIKGKRQRKSKEDGSRINTVDETVKFLREGKNIDQIARERKFTSGTIEGHLAKAIESGSVQIEEIISGEEIRKIASLFPPAREESISLSAIKEKAPAGVSFGKLRMVMAWMKRKG